MGPAEGIMLGRESVPRGIRGCRLEARTSTANVCQGASWGKFPVFVFFSCECCTWSLTPESEFGYNATGRSVWWTEIASREQKSKAVFLSYLTCSILVVVYALLTLLYSLYPAWVLSLLHLFRSVPLCYLALALPLNHSFLFVYLILSLCPFLLGPTSLHPRCRFHRICYCITLFSGFALRRPNQSP